MDECRLIKGGEAFRGKQGLDYFSGVSAESSGSKAICMHLLEMPPGASAKPHYHEAHETVIFVLEGAAEMRHGPKLEHVMRTAAGDFVYIPPGVPHQPYNPSDQVVRAVIARTDPNEQESVILLEDPEAVDARIVPDFETPIGLSYNRGLIADPAAFARAANAESWLYLCGEEFASVEGGMSYANVQAAVGESANIVSDPPRVMDMDLARKHIAALDQLPRPTLVTCRTGPRSSALVYLYAGLRTGANAEDVLARAEADAAPFCGSDELEAWVTQGLDELS